MFPQFKKRNHESGLVLYLVLITVIIIMIFSLGILSQSMNETNYAQQQVDQIVSDQLAKGLYWNSYSNSFSSNALTNMSNVGISTVMQGRTYSIAINYQGAAPAGYNCPTCTTWTSTSNYDTFN